MSYLALAAGLLLLFGGGEALLRGAVAAARAMRLSEIFVGVAIVGFATSAPELFVSVDAALADRPEIALANVIGSNAANLMLILGVGAAIRPVMANRRAIRLDAAWAIAAALATAAVTFAGGLDRIFGIALVFGIAAYLTLGFRQARVVGAAPSEDLPSDRGMETWRYVGLILGGAAALAIGAEFLIYGATAIAKAAGVSDRVIGVSLIALGTSLPELATTLSAARTHRTDVAVGNILGSCVFNVFAILGVAGIVAPFTFEREGFLFDVGVMTLASAAIIAVTMSGRQIGRSFGIGLVCVYTVYIVAIFLAP